MVKAVVVQSKYFVADNGIERYSTPTILLREFGIASRAPAKLSRH